MDKKPDEFTGSSAAEYKQALEFLYSQLPMFSRVGAAAYKPGLERTIQIAGLFDNPQNKLKAIHIAGTNGKGSTSHLIASILQENGYKTALYTSPHLVDFRERIRINGKMIPHREVVDFVKKWRESDKGCNPSFFELTMMMAFDWFARENVDFAVIEVGMGGRLDSTNIINPLISVITNISFDHTQFLGDTLAKIAEEKAGIIKPGIPVIIGEANEETAPIFEKKAKECGSPLVNAYLNPLISLYSENTEWGWNGESPLFGNFTIPLAGDYQKNNINTVLHSVNALCEMGISLDKEKIVKGIEKVEENTGLRGRWTRLCSEPLVICDTGHNEAGLKYNLKQLSKIIEKKKEKCNEVSTLHMVIGFVADKDVEHILPLFPKFAKYYITNAAIPRAMKAEKLAELCKKNYLEGDVYDDVISAYKAAVSYAKPSDVIFIGGSTFIVADLLAALN